MPPLSGEICLLTLSVTVIRVHSSILDVSRSCGNLILPSFADVHYYFAVPSSRSIRDRFDKGSYVYLYHIPTQRKLRLEIANAAGTPDQDAFNGCASLPRAPLHSAFFVPLFCRAVLSDHLEPE